MWTDRILQARSQEAGDHDLDSFRLMLYDEFDARVGGALDSDNLAVRAALFDPSVDLREILVRRNDEAEADRIINSAMAAVRRELELLDPTDLSSDSSTADGSATISKDGIILATPMSGSSDDFLIRAGHALDNAFKILAVNRVKGYSRDPITFWKLYFEHYPDSHGLIGNLVMAHLAMPASSAECERIFSHSGKLSTSGRFSMNTETLEVLTDLRVALLAENDEEHLANARAIMEQLGSMNID